MEVICETLNILQDIDKTILEEVKETIKIEYFESDDDPPIEKLPKFNEVDMNSLSEIISMLNNRFQKEKENDYERTKDGLLQPALVWRPTE
jgi:uncharacterized membrane protein